MQLSENARKQGALWGAEAADWLEIQERTAPPLWQAVLDFAGVGPGTRLLDAGCGAGGASVMAQERGATVTACDASEGLLAIARERLPDVELKLADLESLPFADDAFDVALAINSLQFTNDPARAAHELSRVAPRVGVVVWSVEHSEQRCLFDAIRKLFDKPPRSRGAFALSGPGEVEALFPEHAAESHTIPCPFLYPDLKIALRGQMATGPAQRAAEIFGKEQVEGVLRDALRPFLTASSEVRLQNEFRCVMLLRPGTSRPR